MLLLLPLLTLLLKLSLKLPLPSLDKSKIEQINPMTSIIIDNKTTMEVEFNGTSSSFLELFRRVSQGSVLIPLFF